MSEDKYLKTTDNKIYWIECIRVFSAFLVVMQHSISGMWTSLSPGTIEWKVINLAFLLSRSAVPVFFMCSGMGMLAKERTIESIFKKIFLGLLKPYACAMLVFGLRDAVVLVREGLGSFRTIRNAFLKDIIFGQYHTWFIMTLIGLYLITPLLYEIAKNQKLLNYFVLLSVIFTVVLPLVGRVESLDRLHVTLGTINMRFVTGYVMYYMLGFWISKVKWEGKYFRIAIAALFVVSILAAFSASAMTSIKTGEASQLAYDEFAPLGLMVNVFFLLFFKALIHSENHRKIASKLSGCGMGIYLMHPLFLGILSFFPGVSCLLGGILVWLTALIIALFIGKAKETIRANFS